jgi:hypothetical protein
MDGASWCIHVFENNSKTDEQQGTENMQSYLPQKFRAEASLICRTEALSFVFASPKILISDCPSNRNGRDA